ncbi:membrane-associated tyrosine- and threonine-specific cdc2-inhibitory kinase-like [Diabrotica undecimpunctata]|uniref:membrane-associated tyrosine- and threonine-specific cdc2-inhibitory kinase-like n=1 Tax=Diabrotica undecimpunctata TaxID=50387 RepID=UPI003B634A25
MAWEECGEVYMMMEACQMNLMEYSEKNIIRQPLLWDCLYDMCKALKYMHEKLLVHRDVKATNIMLYGTYFKLADFGSMVDLNVQPESTTMSRKPKLTTKDEVARRYFRANIKPAFDILELGLTFGQLMLEAHRSSPTTTEAAPNLSPNISNSFRAIVNRMIGTTSVTPPTAAAILKLNDMKAVANRWEKNLRTVYTTENLDDLEEKFNIPENVVAVGNPELLNLPGCSKDL